MPDPEEPRNLRGPLVALAVLVCLALGGLWLAGQLRAGNRTQDCVMSGRSNCAPIP